MPNPSSNVVRLIDALPTPTNPRKMQIFVVGLCRTGTTSIRVALSHFGYKVHGMAQAMEDAQGKYWSEAVRLKYHVDDPSNEGLKPYGPAEFKKLLANYDGVTDIPGVLFIDEIREAFPTAKIVVSNRDIDSWWKSMTQTIIRTMRLPYFLTLARIQGGVAKESLTCGYDCTNEIGGGDQYAYLDDEKMRKGFKKHYDTLRKDIPADQRLEFNVKDGWEPLCKFLDLDVPDDLPFPHVNDSKEFMRIFNGMWWTLLGLAAAKAVVGVGVVGYGGMVVAKYLRKG